jgi:hypothetical protein
MESATLHLSEEGLAWRELTEIRVLAGDDVSLQVWWVPDDVDGLDEAGQVLRALSGVAPAEA